MTARVAPHPVAHRSPRAAVAGCRRGLLGLAACGRRPPPRAAAAGRTEAATARSTCPTARSTRWTRPTGPVEVNLWYGGLAAAGDGARRTWWHGLQRQPGQGRGHRQQPGQRPTRRCSASTRARRPPPDQLPDIVYLEDTQLQATGRQRPGAAGPGVHGGRRLRPHRDRARGPGRRTRSTTSCYPGYMNVSTPVLYYNKAHFDEGRPRPRRPAADPGRDPRAAAKKLKAAGVSEKPLSFKVDQLVLRDLAAAAMGERRRQQRQRPRRPATEATFDTPEAERRSLELLEQMNDEGLLNAFANTEGSIDQYLALATQDSSMLIETSTASSTIAGAAGRRAHAAEDRRRRTSTPRSLDRTRARARARVSSPGSRRRARSTPGGGAFYILNTSEPAQQAASWKFLEFMLQPENAKTWHLEGGYLPIVKSVRDEPEVQAFWEDELAGVLLKPAVDQLGAADPDQPGPLIGPVHGVVRTSSTGTWRLDAVQRATTSGQGAGQRPRSRGHRGAEGLQRLTRSDPAATVPIGPWPVAPP